MIKEFLASTSEEGNVSGPVNVSLRSTIYGEKKPTRSASNFTGAPTVNVSPTPTTVETNPQRSPSNLTGAPTVNVSPAPTMGEASPSRSASNSAGVIHRLKPLILPVYNGDKTRFEDFWALFVSVVDEGDEPINIKMARLRQNLSRHALDAIRGLGVTAPEYQEAKEILKAKFGGKRRQLHAYLDQLENMPTLKNNDLHSWKSLEILCE